MPDESDDFVKVMLDLSKELAEKGARGEKLTDAEMRFLKQSALMLINALVFSKKSKTESAEPAEGVH